MRRSTSVNASDGDEIVAREAVAVKHPRTALQRGCETHLL